MYTIDLKDPIQFTRANVARLIGSELDSQNWQLRVKKDGIAYLSEIVGNKDLANLCFRLETWVAGNNYVGFQAEHDDEWVDDVYESLKQNWPDPKAPLIDW